MTNATQPTLSTFPSQRLTLSLATWGDPAHPPLILVHGGRDQKHSWQNVAARLAARYHVHAHDLRGHGQSDWVNDGEYGVMDHVYDLASLVDHLGLDTFTLVGHSLGGNIAVRYTGLFPEKVEKLTAIEGLGPSPKMLAERKATPAHERLHAWIEGRRKLSPRQPRIMADVTEAKSRMAAAFTHLPDALIHHLTETGIKTNPDGTVSWAYDPAGMGRSPSDISHKDFVHLWTRITCPTWLVYGATSWASNPESDGRAAHFQNATITEIENAGHWLHHDQFDAFMAGLEGFLA
jgi:pimeloyl-ACP methyl ester carboxylesterase